MMKLTPFGLLLSSLLVLGACSNGAASVKDTLGLTKSSPDEFAVVKRAPLEMPPDYSLRPPQPGAARPQEQATAEQAKQTVFGSAAPAATGAQPAAATGAESSFLQQAGAGVADPAVRTKIDAEAEEFRDVNKPVVKKIMGDLGNEDPPSANVVDAKAEAERLRKNKEEGKPVTDGVTPYIEE